MSTGAVSGARVPGWITLRISPSVNHYKQFYCERSTEYDVHRVKARVSKRALVYKEEVGWLVKQAYVRMEEHADISLQLHVYQRKHGLDLDNVLKVLLDALNGIAYEDDRQVAEIYIRRHRTSGQGRIDLLITKMEDEGGK